MRRTPLVAFAATLAVGALLFLGLALFRGTSLAYTLGVPPQSAVVKLRHGTSFCQEPIAAQSTRKFDRIDVSLGTFHRPGPPLAVTVRDGRTAAPLAHGTLPGGYPDIGIARTQTIRLDAAVNPSTLSVCFTNTGRHSVAFYGAAGVASAPSEAIMDGRDLGVDAALVFEAPHHSWWSSIGAAFDHARWFRTPRISGALYLLGLIALALIACAGVATTVRSGLKDDEPAGDERD